MKVVYQVAALVAGLACAFNVQVAEGEVQVRIVGGDETGGLHEAPWMVSVQADRSGGWKHVCGATLVHSKYVLTAGHCVSPSDSFNGRLVIGQYDLSGAAETGSKILSGKKVHMLPSYDFIVDDIALIELSEPVTDVPILALNADVQNSMERAGKKLEVLGWGYLDQDTPVTSDRLRAVQVPVVSNNECGKSYDTIIDSVICAGEKNGGKDACSGDSGGPLVYSDQNGKKTQVGIVSYGEGCAQARMYGVYTRVSSHIAWIRSIIGEDENVPVTARPTQKPTSKPTARPSASAAPPASTSKPTPLPTPLPTPVSDDTDFDCYRYQGNPGPLKKEQDCVLPFTYMAPDGSSRVFDYPPTLKEATPYIEGDNLDGNDDRFRWCPLRPVYNNYDGKRKNKILWGVAICRNAGGLPTPEPTSSPTTAAPTTSPTTPVPTRSPTRSPTPFPTVSPTKSPTTPAPTQSPTQAPTTLDFALRDIVCRSMKTVEACAENDWNSKTCIWTSSADPKGCRARADTKAPTSSPTKLNTASPDGQRKPKTNDESSGSSTLILSAGVGVVIVVFGGMAASLFIVRNKRAKNQRLSSQSSFNNKSNAIAVAGPATMNAHGGSSFNHGRRSPPYANHQMSVPPPPGF